MDTWASSCGFRIGTDRSLSVLITEKLAVFAPMPSASVSTATAVKPGFFRSWRRANLRSFMARCLYGIDFCSTPRGQPAGDQRCDAQRNRGDGAGEKSKTRRQHPNDRFLKTVHANLASEYVRVRVGTEPPADVRENGHAIGLIGHFLVPESASHHRTDSERCKKLRRH